ncbi:MAG: hypothetical protein ACTHJ0_12935 [Flavipsychrobacter sp.]
MYIAQRIKTGTMLMAIAMLSLSACKRNNSSTDSASADDVGTVTDQTQLERENNDVDNIADVAYTTGASNLRTTPADLGSCVTVTRDTSVMPHLLTIDFGTTDCLCADGRYRRGKILVSYTKGYKDSGSVRIITFSNYYVDENQLTGKKTVTNMGTNSIGQFYYDIEVNDSLILSGGGTISWTSSRTRTWIEGYKTALRGDDVYNIAGSATITRASGKTISVNITTPLRVAVDCPWIEAGEATITRPSGGVMTINYGTGTCDRLATATIGGHTYSITLK